MRNLFIGFDAQGKKIYLTPEDRATHMHIIGSSGSGKTKFMEWMIRGDIKNNQGLCLIDPHGSLYEDIVKWCAYHHLLEKNIILLNPSSGDHVVGFNPFQRTGEDISVKVDYQITATIRAWGLEDTDETPTLERWLRCIYHTLNEKNLTISAAQYLISYFEKEVRDYLTSGLSSSLIKEEWRELSLSKTPIQFHEQILSTKNKLFRFLCSKQIQRFMGSEKGPQLDLREIMDKGKILLVNLAESEYLSRENARLFGALLVNEFFQQAKRRKPDQFGRPPKPFYLYLDEFQNYVSSDIAYILDQARKFGLHLILAHQRLGHLEREKDVIDAVLTNAKIKAVFGGLRRSDAKLMVEEMFVNQLDLKEIKKAIYQTKFWPLYSRDKVYTTARGHTTGHFTSEATGTGMTIREPEGEGWFETPAVSFTEHSSFASGEMEAETETEAVADIPIFIPVPLKELTSEEYWKLEEQIWRMSDALKAQFPRHCFIKILNQKTQPMLVPKVKDYALFEETLLNYQHQLCTQINALPKSEVDKLLKQQKDYLELEAKSMAVPLEPTTFRHKIPRKS